MNASSSSSTAPTAPLDTAYEVSFRPVRDANPHGGKRRPAYARRNIATSLLQESFPRHRVHSCGVHVARSESPTVVRYTESGKHGLAGMVSCGSIWVCAYCRARISSTRAREVEAALREAATQGLNVYFVTFTASHSVDDRLDSLWPSVIKSHTKVFEGRRGVRLMKDAGYVGRIVSNEVTYGASGWHPHIHVLFFCRGELNVDSLWEEWQLETKKRGLKVSRDAFNVQRVDGKQSAETVAAYMSKASPWTAADEMTRIDAKKARAERCTPMELLDAVEQDGDADARDAFLEYVSASKGVNSLRWSRGLREKLGLGKEKSDVEAANESTLQSEPVRVMTPREWTAVRLGGFEGLLLNAADDEGLVGIERVIEHACRSFYSRRSLS